MKILFNVTYIELLQYIVLSSVPKLSEFQRLGTLILRDIQSKYPKNLWDQLHSLLGITSIDHVPNINLIYRQIFGLHALKYCKLSLISLNTEVPLVTCTNEYSSIQHLVIMNVICCYQLHSLLSYVPQLRRLSIRSLTGSWTKQKNVSRSFINHLAHLSLGINSLMFDSLVQLITNYLPNVRVFDIYIDCGTWDTNEQVRIESQIKQFTSSFWIERQWFFYTWSNIS